MPETENKRKFGFQKGASGNPRGRPKDVFGLAKEARKWGPQAVQVLADMMLDDAQPGKTRVAAAQALLDRGFGKAIQTHSLDGVSSVAGLVISIAPPQPMTVLDVTPANALPAE